MKPSSAAADQLERDRLDAFTREQLLPETRRGLVCLCSLNALLLAVMTVLFLLHELPRTHYYTVLLLGIVTLHVGISIRAMTDLRTLNLMGVTLVVASALGFGLLTQIGSRPAVPLAAMALLLPLVTLVPWPLRPAAMASTVVCALFFVSSVTGAEALGPTLVTVLQLIFTGVAIASLVTVSRNADFRARELRLRFELDAAHRRMLKLAHKDPLTGAWNRRYLQGEFAARVEEWLAVGASYHFAVVEVGDLTHLNQNFGRGVGDAVLEWTSLSFEQALGARGCVVRLGGDEFALLFSDDRPVEQVSRGVASIAQRSAATSPLLRYEIRVSIGMVTVQAGRASSKGSIVEEARAALAEAKDRKTAIADGANLVRRFLDTPPESDNVIQLR